MNYRHIYHAGNFADVFKHAILARVIEYLKRKEAAFRVIDTHAGIGVYDLSSVEAEKTGEWREGIGRLLAAELAPSPRDLLEPYLAVVREHVSDGVLRSYPGSPALARALLRRQDRLSLFELHEADAATLAERFAGDFQTRVTRLDGWLVPGAHLPPKENRGLVLIDPPFEIEGDFARMIAALEKGGGRWPGGVFLLWYPLKRESDVRAFREALTRSRMRNLLCVEMALSAPGAQPGLHGCGMIVKNPPFVLRAELETMLPALLNAFARDPNATLRLEMLRPE